MSARSSAAPFVSTSCPIVSRGGPRAASGASPKHRSLSKPANDELACRRPAGTATSPAAMKSATRRVEGVAFCGGSSAPKPAWPGAAVAAAPRNIARLPKGAKFGGPDLS